MFACFGSGRSSFLLFLRRTIGMLVLAILFTKGSADIARFFEPQCP